MAKCKSCNKETEKLVRRKMVLRGDNTASYCERCAEYARYCKVCEKYHPPEKFASRISKVCKRCSKKAKELGVPDAAPIEIQKEKVAAEAKRLLELAPIRPVDSELAARELARRRLIQFIRRFHPNYKAGWVHHDICERLERFSADVAAERSPRLMLLMPPRHGKSTIVSKYFPSWHLGRHPDHEFIGCSYNLDLAREFSRAIRDTLRDKAYTAVFPETKLDPESQSVEQWKIAKRSGAFLAAGISGGITGRGAHVLSIDDPVKNQQEAESFDYCANVMSWYRTTAYTRLAPGGGVLVVMTWWSEIDLAGQLQLAMKDAEEDQFEVVKYAALNETYDEWRERESRKIIHLPPGVKPESPAELLRKAGTALHPERYSAEQLGRIKKTLGPRYWNALFQQNPMPDEGAFFKQEWMRYDAVPPERSTRLVLQAWDFSLGEKDSNDWIVGVTGIFDENGAIHLTDMLRFRSADQAITIDMMIDFWLKGQPHVLGVEDGHIWRSIKSFFERRCIERGVYPVYEELRPTTDKLVRAGPLRARAQLGQFYLPRMETNGWVADVVGELLRFPHGQFDDIVDALSWLARLALTRGTPMAPGAATKHPVPVSWKDKIERLAVTQGIFGTHMSA